MRIETSRWRALPQGRAPERTLIAIGDLHGHSDAARMLLGHLKMYIEERRLGEPLDLVFLGDLIDRGPDPLGVLELAVRGIEVDHVDEHLILGNHDWFLLAAAGLADEPMRDEDRTAWILHGGRETFQALELPINASEADIRRRLSIGHIGALKQMRLMFRSGSVLCVHAGVDHTLPAHAQTPETLLWIREPFLDIGSDELAEWPIGLTVVHGHTPRAAGVYAHRIGVDTGGYSTGIFTAAELTDRAVRFHRVVRSG